MLAIVFGCSMLASTSWVARAIELSVSQTTRAIGTLGSDVDGLVTEMESLRQALEET